MLVKDFLIYFIDLLKQDKFTKRGEKACHFNPLLKHKYFSLLKDTKLTFCLIYYKTIKSCYKFL